MKEDEMLNFLMNTFPNLEIREVQANTNGWDNNIYILNNEIVFRFPKSEDLLSKILNEGKILNLLKYKKPILCIPDYEYVFSGSDLKGVKYSFLKGKSLGEYPINNLRDNPNNAKLIGDFLTKLHSIDVSNPNLINLETIHTLKYWENLYSSVKNDIFPFLNDQRQNEINEVFTNFIDLFPSLTFKKSIIHGDLTASNIIYNKGKNCIDGIIDFTDAQIGDPAFDFAGLYWSFGSEFTKDVLSWYSAPESSENLFNRVKNFYGLQPVFHEILFAVKNNQQINWDTAFEKFSYLKNLYET
ncbi:aminoglycoside phosphotransferase family protein [Bacillus sp. JJ1474]|uniref:aminoglycoside phosphotransferase family protein n=2 Tax=unclassified Bacillus (in: firmicutes) TaxID=185979 RepID=UPI002FFD5FFB